MVGMNPKGPNADALSIGQLHSAQVGSQPHSTEALAGFHQAETQQESCRHNVPTSGCSLCVSLLLSRLPNNCILCSPRRLPSRATWKR